MVSISLELQWESQACSGLILGCFLSRLWVFFRRFSVSWSVIDSVPSSWSDGPRFVLDADSGWTLHGANGKTS